MVVRGRRDQPLCIAIAAAGEGDASRELGKGKSERGAERAGPAQPLSLSSDREGPTMLAESAIPSLPRLDTATRAKTTGIGELGVWISGIWSLGFKTDEAYEFRV